MHSNNCKFYYNIVKKLAKNIFSCFILENISIKKRVIMKVQNIRRINNNKMSFRGVFANKIRETLSGIDKKHSEVRTTDYLDDFHKNIDAIDKWYDTESQKAREAWFFRKSKLKRIDEQYKAKNEVWKQDTEIFIQAKEAHLQDIEQLLENAKKYNTALEEINRLKEEARVTASTIQLVKQQQAANKNSGFNRLAGYESEKTTLQRYLINPIFEEQSGKPIKLPNAILFFGPTGVGKTTFAIALAQEIKEGKEPVKIDMTNDPDEIMEEIEVMSRRARKHYKETGERTLILLDEVETIANDDSEVLDELKAKLTKAFKEDKCIYIMTSNNPTLISKDILTPDRTGLIVSVDPPDYDNAQAVTEFYFKNLKNANIDYSRLARVLTQQKNGAYSNSGIEEIYKSCCTMKISSTDDIINAINSTQPNITRSELASYENDKNRFLGNA